MNNGLFLSFVLNTNPGITGLIITDSFRTARNLFNETAGTIQTQNEKNISLLIKRADEFRLELNNGSRLFALVLNKDYICGIRADFVITDISEQMDEMREVIYPLIIAPVTFKDGKITAHKRLQFIYSLSNESLRLI